MRIHRWIAVLMALLLMFTAAACAEAEVGSYSRIPSDVSVQEEFSLPAELGQSSSESEASSAEPSSIAEASSEEPSEVSSEISSEVSSKPETLAGAIPESTRADASYFDDALFIGDSVSLKLEYYNAAMDELGGAQFLTCGSFGSGNALKGVGEDDSVHPEYNGEEMLLEDAIPLIGAKKIYIMLGMNDIGLYGVEEAVENYATMVERILANAPDVKIYVQSMTPLASTSQITGGDLNNDNVRIYNQKLLALCEEKGWYFVDVASVMYDDSGSLIMEYCSDPDDMGVHFTEAGCEAWIDYLYTHTAE